MRYIADHDFHIHSTASPCCHDEFQTPDTILSYALENDFNTICLTNHLWDENVFSEAQWHDMQRFDYISSVLPLPQDEKVRFLFGAEVDMDYNYVLGISSERMSAFDFINISTTHLHLDGNTVKTPVTTAEEAAMHWFNRIEALLKMDLPRNKTGIAHLTCGHIFRSRTAEVIELLDSLRLYDVFKECSLKKIGIELNMKTISMSPEIKDIMLRPYFIAKECGCKFYLGSDSHKRSAFIGMKENFENIISELDLQESDKFTL